MKTTLFLTFNVFLAINVLAQTQDWRPIRTDGTYMYSLGDIYRAIRIDTIYSVADTAHLFGHSEINFNEETWCYNPYGAPWFGKEIINYPDSTIILNRFNETLVFPLNPDTTWILYNNKTDTIWAQVKNTTESAILETIDSVRVINIWSNDKINPIAEEIQISKNFGFVAIFNLSMFPKYLFDEYEYDHYFNATLAGIEKVNKGIQNQKFPE